MMRSFPLPIRHSNLLPQTVQLQGVSPLLSYLGILYQSSVWPKLLSLILFYSPGWLFAVLVLTRMASGGNGVWWRRIRLVVASTLVWHIALRVAIYPWPTKAYGVVSCALAGVIGAALIWVACRFIIPQRFTLMQIVVALLAGILGGASIGMIAVDWMVTWLKSVGYVGGFFIWQMGVAFALFGGYFLGSKASGEPTQEPRS